MLGLFIKGIDLEFLFFLFPFSLKFDANANVQKGNFG